MADLVITTTVKSANKKRVTDAFKGLYSIPGDPANAGVPQYTDDEWVQERVNQFIRETVLRYEQRAAMGAAKDAVAVPDDIVV